MQLAFGVPLKISHLRVFGCAVYVPIAPPNRTKIGPQRHLGIYVGFDTPTIIRYLEPLTGDVFKARMEDCEFDEKHYPNLGKTPQKSGVSPEITWSNPKLGHFDPRTRQCDEEILKIIHLQNTVHLLPDKFTDNPKVVRSHVPAVNTPARIDIPQDGCNPPAAGMTEPRKKRGRPPGSKKILPKKRVNLSNGLTYPSQTIT